MSVKNIISSRQSVMSKSGNEIHHKVLKTTITLLLVNGYLTMEEICSRQSIHHWYKGLFKYKNYQNGMLSTFIGQLYLIFHPIFSQQTPPLFSPYKFQFLDAWNYGLGTTISKKRAQ